MDARAEQFPSHQFRRPMKRIAVVTVGALVMGLMSLVGVTIPLASAEPPSAGDGLTVFVGELSADQLMVLVASGVDRQEVTATAASGGGFDVEVVLRPDQAAKLRAQGVELQEKVVDGATVSQRLNAEAAKEYSVFRSYSEPGGIKDEMEEFAAKHRNLVKLEVIGHSVQGQEIIALKVTADARNVADGSRPAVLYASAQHAREWITPEMNRRLLRFYVNSYGSNPVVQEILDTTELWFVPVANPDGYDYTFTKGNRLWRKNLQDNDGDGQITGADGVDPNRNFPTKWGYDNEGSSPVNTSETFRGTAPKSEPETQALDGLMNRIRFEFLVNYHSAAELLLYGVGWQVATPSPDDLIYEALAGDDANPAIAGYDPDISAELYTTNGETNDRASTRYGTLAFTPEMATCETASASDPDDAFDPADCNSGFNFPDSEKLVQAEFRKNLAFAVSIAQSAQDPANPVSALGLQTPDFDVDSFDVSYGNPQTVAVTARRSLKDLTLHYSINGEPPVTASVTEWLGGERYGDTGNNYYAEFRGKVRGTVAGDEVKVWFSGKGQADDARTLVTKRSEHFTYTVAQDRDADVLVVANEDYEGVNPTYPSAVTKAKYARMYVRALRAKDISASVWDVSKRGVPHSLGALDHFDAVVWYLGDNRLTQDPSDEVTDIFGNPFPDASVAERQQYLTLSVRDYLNGGGKLLQTGETASYYGTLGSTLGGIYYGLDGAPEESCVVTTDAFSDCLLLADDFSQYYLGAYSRSASEAPDGVTGIATPLTGTSASFGGPAVVDNPLAEAGSFSATSDLLPSTEFPQFASTASGVYEGGSGGVFSPVEGDWYVGALHTDDTYTRLGRTIDLTDVTAGDAPSLDFALSFDTEARYDNVIVEAHTVGADDWTTLPEAGGLSNTKLPAQCGAGFYLDEHPFLSRYITQGRPCTATGTTGSWNRMTTTSNGWQQVSFDLSDYAGEQVEVNIAYVTDQSAGGVGAFVDDTRVVVDGTVTRAQGFETGLGAWSIQGAPPGSPEVRVGFKRAESLFSAAITTADTVLFGFGVEQLATPEERAKMLGKAMNYLLS